MRQIPWLAIVAGIILAIIGGSWYIGRVNSSHPAPLPSMGGGSGHRNFAPAPLPATAAREKSVALEDTDASSPVVWTDGTMYLTAGSKVIAYAPDLNRKWAWDSQNRLSAVALGRQGQVYALGNNAVYALTPEGTMQWEKQIELTGPLAFFVGQGGTIYAGGTDFLYALTDDGTVKWRFKGENIKTGPVETERGRLALVLGSRLYVLNRDGDTVAYREVSQVPDDIYRLAVGPEGKIYVTTDDELIAYDSKGQFEAVGRPSTTARVNYVAVGNDFVQVGYERWRSAVSGPVTRVQPPGSEGMVPYMVVDSEGKALVYEFYTNTRQRSLPQLRMLDNHGQVLWTRADIALANPPSVTGDGRVCYVHQATRGPRATMLTCLWDD